MPIVICLASLCFLQGCTETKSEELFVKVKPETLNLRDSSSIDSKIIDKIPQKTILKLLQVDTVKRWCKVEYNGKVGFASADFLLKYKPPSKFDEFKADFVLGLVFAFLFLYGIKHKIADGRYSKGYKDGKRRFGILTVIILSVLIGLVYAVLKLF